MINWMAVKYYKEEGIKLGLDPHLIHAFIEQESNGNPLVVRYEPGWKYAFDTDKFAKMNGISEITERVLQSISFGCLQLMGTGAREQGYTGMLTALVDNATCAKYALTKLAKLDAKYDSEASVIASWNGGNAIKVNGVYRNQPYVDSVLAKLKKLRGY